MAVGGTVTVNCTLIINETGVPCRCSEERRKRNRRVRVRADVVLFAFSNCIARELVAFVSSYNVDYGSGCGWMGIRSSAQPEVTSWSDHLGVLWEGNGNCGRRVWFRWWKDLFSRHAPHTRYYIFNVTIVSSEDEEAVVQLHCSKVILRIISWLCDWEW